MESTNDTPEGGKKAYPTPFQKRTFWSAITAFSIVLIGAIAVGVIMISGTVLGYLQPVLVPLAVAGIIAYLLEPIVEWLTRRGIKHGRAMLLVFVGFMLFVSLLVVTVVLPTVDQANEFYDKRESIQEKVTESVKAGISSAQARFDTGIAEKYYQKGVEWVSKEGPHIASNIGQWLWTRVSGAFGFFGYLLGMFLVPIYLFYFLREGHKISKSWSDYVPIRASKFKDEVVETLTEVNGYLISFFRGQMVVSLIDGALIAIALSLLGLPYALLIGVFLAILGLIPYIGNLIVMIPALIIAIAHFGATEWEDLKQVAKPTPVVMTNPIEEPGASDAETEMAPDVHPLVGQVVEIKIRTGKGEIKVDRKVATEISEDGKQAKVLVNAWNWLPNVWAYPLIVLAIFVILQQINGLVTAPKIVGDSVGLHPLTVIFSVLFWSLLLGGLLGALLAVPLTAAIKVLFRRYIWEKRLEPAVEKRLKAKADEGDSEIEAADPA